MNLHECSYSPFKLHTWDTNGTLMFETNLYIFVSKPCWINIEHPHKHISFSMRTCSRSMWSYQCVVGFALSVSSDEVLYILSLAWEAGWYACNPWHVKVLPSFWSLVLHSWHQTGLDMTWFWYHVQSHVETTKLHLYKHIYHYMILYAVPVTKALRICNMSSLSSVSHWNSNIYLLL